MKALKIIGIILLVLIAAFLVMALTQPTEGSLESTTIIEAPPSAVYEECIDMKKLDSWSPWYKMDPSAYTYEGPASGIGATSEWDSDNPNLGKGSITIVEAEPNSLVRTKMVFEDYEGTYGSYIKLDPVAAGTKTTWGYTYSDLDLVGRFFMSIMDINDEMLPQFEQGLSDLKQKVEGKKADEPVMKEGSLETDSTMVDGEGMTEETVENN